MLRERGEDGSARFLEKVLFMVQDIEVREYYGGGQLVQEGVQGGWWSLWPQNQRDSCSAVEAATISQIFRQHLVS